jgi:signal transduction histidine kinase
MFSSKEALNLVVDKNSGADSNKVQEAEIKKINMLGQLAFGIVHDMRNSLQILRASAMMIRKHADDAKVERYVDDIDRVIDSSAQMAERVLSFSNKSVDLLCEIDLCDPLDETLALSGYLIPSHIRIDYTRPDRDMSIMGSDLELSQALLNLIKNAGEAIEDAGQEGVITISLQECFPWIELKIKDNGCGIVADQIEHVFDPLFTTKEDGTGIGLANVWATIESHGGVISVKSEVGKGSEFTIMLPKKS